MTTFAELKSALSRELMDPDALVFNDNALSDLLNAAVAEVSRISPQPFLEDVPIVSGRTRYRLRGGTANQVPNASFETGDDTILVTAPVTVAAADAPALLAGWNLLADTPLHFPNNVNRITGTRVARLVPTVGQTDATMYVDIPVNAGTAYLISAMHCKELAGGNASRIEIETRDVNNDLIDSVFTHDTTAASMVEAQFSYTTADDGSEAYLRIKLVCLDEQPTTQQAFLFEDVSVAEASQAVLVAGNAVNSIEVSRVEIWSVSDGILSPYAEVPRPGTTRISYSESGWRVWGGTLEVPKWVLDCVQDGSFIRVWGYAPYDALVDDSQVTDLTAELEWAAIKYAKIQGLERLVWARDQFGQWQQQANNTDVTPASLMNQLALLRSSWRQTENRLYQLRS